jgi:hypothetical protein
MVVFSNGFEEGDFSAWSGTDGTPTIVESPTHHGRYAMKLNAIPEYARIAVPDNDTLHVKCSFRLTEIPTAEDPLGLLDVGSAFWAIISYVQVIDDAIGYACQFPGRGDWIPVEWQINQWYTFELKSYRHATEGELRFWFDGVDVSSWTDLDTSGIPDDGYYVMFGSRGAPEATYTTYIDCCAVDNAFIGIEEYVMPSMMNHYRRINKIIRG